MTNAATIREQLKQRLLGRSNALDRLSRFIGLVQRSRSGFRWDLREAAYIDNATGAVVPDVEVLFELGQYESWVSGNVRNITQELIDGAVDVNAWQLAMRDELRDSWRTTYMLGRGGIEQMGPDDWGRLGGNLNREYRRLYTFAVSISEGRMTAPQIQARARQYASAVRTAHGAGRTIGYVSAGYTEERRVLTPAEHCEDCQGYAAQGWQPIGTLPEPGSGSRCHRNCKCIKEYRR